MSTAVALLTLLGLAVWAVLALVGWVLPLRDGVERFTFRYLAWGALLAVQLIRIADWRWSWSMAINALVALFCLSRVSHWWNLAEARRASRRPA